MPEYLAPGVYVEETSFRSKSIEGVGTSTTAFAGPTRKGPVGVTPPLLTSFGEFERIYGGLEDLDFGGPETVTNYLAHSVLAYFNEGGARLYVSRVDTRPDPGQNPDAQSSTSARVGDPANPLAAGRVRIVARSHGVLGDGRAQVFVRGRGAARGTLMSAPVGTLVRRGGTPATAARMVGGRSGPFPVENNSQLVLNVSGATRSITIQGTRASLTGAVPLANPTVVAAGDAELVVTLDGVAQRIPVPRVNNQTPQDVVNALNAVLRAGHASLDAQSRLVIRGDIAGLSGQVLVARNDSLGLTAGAQAAGAGNVADLNSVTARELDAALATAAAGVTATADPNNGRLILTTTATGEAATLDVAQPGAGVTSAHGALGLALPAAGAPVNAGTNGQAVGYFVKVAGAPDNYRSEQDVDLGLAGMSEAALAAAGLEILSATIVYEDGAGTQFVQEELALAAVHPRYIGTILAAAPPNQAEALGNPIAVLVAPAMSAFALRRALEANPVLALGGGDDGGEPTVGGYAAALAELSRLEDISIVAAPGYAAFADGPGIQAALVTHVDTRTQSRYRIAVLEAPENQTPDEVRAWRSRVDSTRAALYYPWVVVANPLARPGRDEIPRELTLPPSGFLCGIYARNDIERTVSKAPANEVVRSAIRFNRDINFAQQEVLNPLGVNCLRYFPGRGYRVWGARTTSSDPEWKYVNVRRYFNFLEASIDRGTQWAVFESNGERLWANVRETIEGFLYNEWVSGNLLGGSPKEAYFVRCDRSTMTQNDLDNGRLICLIGVAALKPAEFVIFRIGQKTADART